MDFKFTTKDITNKVATMLLYSEIGGYGVNGEEFARELNFLMKDPAVNSVDVRINTPGGSIQEGFAIVSAIQNANKPVNTIVDGLAASMGSVIAAVGDNRSIVDFGIVMIHDPHVGVDPEDLDEDTKKVLATFKESILTIYDNNTNLDKEKASSMMLEDTWMDASEALELGFVDEIVETGKKAQVGSIQNLEKVEVYNKLKRVVNSLNKPISKMQKVANYLNIVEASEDKVLVALKAKDSVIQNLEASVKELEGAKAELEEIKAKDAEMKRNEAKDYILSLVTDGKLKNEEAVITSWTDKAADDFEGVKALFDGIEFKAAAKIPMPNNDESVMIPQERKEWGAREWDKHDPKGLEKIRVQDPILYQELNEKSYNKKEA